jgi:hypothetical protein
MPLQQLLVRKVPGQFVLKAEVAAQLAQSYQHMGEVEYQAKALTDGLQLTLAEVSAADKWVTSEGAESASC